MNVGVTEILVITLESPLGEHLAVKRAGEEFYLILAGRKQSVEVIDVR